MTATYVYSPKKRKGSSKIQLQGIHSRTAQWAYSRASSLTFQSKNETSLCKKYIINNIEIKHRYNRLYLKCQKSKANTQPGEKPAAVKTHLRDAIIMPEMVGNNVAVHNGKTFNIV